MRIAVDSSVIIAGVHANHPRHALAAGWIVRALSEHRLVVSHHSALEAYAVLTRLPGDFRVTPSEERDLLATTVQANMAVVPFAPESIWKTLESLVMSTVAGGRSYDAFVAQTLREAGVEAIAAFSPDHFDGLADMGVIDPSAAPL